MENQIDASAKIAGEAGQDAAYLPAELIEKIRSHFPRYPTRRAVVLPALHLIQESLGAVPLPAVRELAGVLEIPAAEIQDALSFYHFFKQDQRLGRYRIWVCRSLSCALRDGEALLEYLQNRLGIKPGETTPDGRFTLEVAECLGACEVSPAVLINDTLYKLMTPEKLDAILNELP